MTTYQTTVKAEPQSGHRVSVEFANGEQGVFDFTPYLAYPCYAPLKDMETFSQVVAAHGTLMWPGELDIAPEAVWNEARRKTKKREAARA